MFLVLTVCQHPKSSQLCDGALVHKVGTTIFPFETPRLKDYSHIYRTLNKVTLDDFDITGPQMVLTLKLTSFAWSVWDGRRPAEVGFVFLSENTGSHQ